MLVMLRFKTYLVKERVLHNETNNFVMPANDTVCA